MQESRLGPIIVTIIGVASFIVAKASTIAPRFSDGHIYSYMGWLVTQGYVPYRDFYYSSPPFLPYFYALIGGLYGFSWQDALLTTLLLTALSAWLMFRIVLTIGSAWTAAGTALIFLSSFCLWATTDFASDVHVITTLMLGGLYLALRRQRCAAGIVFALCALTKLYSLVGILGLFLAWIGQRRQRDLMVIMAGFFAGFGAVMLIFATWLGTPFVDQVLWNNMGRGIGIDKAQIFAFALKHDPSLVMAIVVALSLSALPRFWPKLAGPHGPVLMLLVAFAAFYLWYPDIYYLYLLPAVASAAMLIGLSLPIAETKRLRWLTVGYFSLGAAYTLWSYWTIQRQAGVIDNLAGIVSRVRELTHDHEAIYGDYEFTPLVALEADRRIAAQLVETNVKFFSVGVLDWEQRLRQVREAGAQLVLTKALIGPEGGVVAGPERVFPLHYFQASCRIDSVWPISHDYSSNAIILWWCAR